MSDSTPVAAPVVSPTPAPAASDVKSGIWTTEHFLALIIVAGCGAAIKALIGVLPAIIANPAVPGWASAVLGLAPIGLAWVAKEVAVEYATLRTQLKLGPDSDVSDAQNAGAAAASNPLTTINK